MFRKLMIALSAVAALGAASLAPTAASAHKWHGHKHGHWHGHGHGHFHKHFHGIYWGGYGGCYVVRKLVPTPYGYVKRRVTICN